MDAKIDTRIFRELHCEIDRCKQSLESAVLTVKSEFRIIGNALEGEQMRIFQKQAMDMCNDVVTTTNELSQAKMYLQKLEVEIVEYDRTRMN